MATEIATAAVAIVGALLGSVWCWLRWRANLTPEVRRLMVEMRATLDWLIAEDGLNSARFADVVRRQQQGLEDLVTRVNDRELRRGCNEVLEAWREVRWSAVPPEGIIPVAVQVWQAMATKEAIGVVSKRVNTLERLLPPRD
ncbi:MAG: hypothetical protein ACRDYX_22930 [Egibacteraceae bacterium]